MCDDAEDLAPSARLGRSDRVDDALDVGVLDHRHQLPEAPPPPNEPPPPENPPPNEPPSEMPPDDPDQEESEDPEPHGTGVGKKIGPPRRPARPAAKPGPPRCVTLRMIMISTIQP